MKKIGILTFHRALNVGACLQAFALAHYLKENNPNVSVELIDYINNNFRKQRMHSYEGNDVFKRVAAFFLFGHKTRKKRISFDSFIEKSPVSSVKYNESNIHCANNQYDYFIVGSDQVFNPFPSRNDTNYFLSFVDDKNKKYSYAASLGKNKLDKELVSLYKKYLNDFSVLSIREQTGIKLLEQINIQSPLRNDIDPTFLLSIDEWKQVINYSKKNTKYVFVYEIFYDDILLKKAIEYADKNNAMVISNVLFLKKNSLNKKIKLTQIEPRKWLELMMDADAVFTNSFHGVSFSINFQKHFFVNKNSDKYGSTITSRITDLLAKVGFEHKYVPLEEKTDDFFNEKENFLLAKEKLKDDIDKSKEYLLSFGENNELS